MEVGRSSHAVRHGRSGWRPTRRSFASWPPRSRARAPSCPRTRRRPPGSDRQEARWSVGDGRAHGGRSADPLGPAARARRPSWASSTCCSSRRQPRLRRCSSWMLHRASSSPSPTMRSSASATAWAGAAAAWTRARRSSACVPGLGRRPRHRHAPAGGRPTCAASWTATSSTSAATTAPLASCRVVTLWEESRLGAERVHRRFTNALEPTINVVGVNDPWEFAPEANSRCVRRTRDEARRRVWRMPPPGQAIAWARAGVCPTSTQTS